SCNAAAVTDRSKSRSSILVSPETANFGRASVASNTAAAINGNKAHRYTAPTANTDQTSIATTSDAVCTLRHRACDLRVSVGVVRTLVAVKAIVVVLVSLEVHAVQDDANPGDAAVRKNLERMPAVLAACLLG